MRLRDKILNEKGFVTKAKVKWFGGIDFQYPYLWKTDKSDIEYKELWGDPRIIEAKKVKAQKQIVIPKIKRKPKMKSEL